MSRLRRPWSSWRLGGPSRDGQFWSENRWRNEDEAVDLGAIRYTVYPCMPYFQSKPCVRDGTFRWENWG